MSKINIKTRIIGKSGNLLILSNDWDASLDNPLSQGFIVEVDTGVHLTETYPLDYLFRINENSEWTPMNIFYDKVYPEYDRRNYSRDGLIGLAVGDALGVPVEFLDRDTVRKINVCDMMGKDTNVNFKSYWSGSIPAGAWSDDTSMTYATMDSIVRNKGIDYTDIMNSYLNWWTKGEYTSLNAPFGLGRTVNSALNRFVAGIPALDCGGKDERDNGNGALMRIFPISLYCIESGLSEEETAKIISESSAITHGHDISKMSCFIYTKFMEKLIETKNPKLAMENLKMIDYSKYFSKEAIAAHKRLFKGYFEYTPESEIKGSGYVVDSLECAIYSIMNTNNFEDAVLMAINTGYDTDTIGAITGSLAGVLYGEENIPDRWKNRLKKKDELDLISLKYHCLLDSKKKNNLESMLSDIKKEVDESNDNTKIING